jgi:hypothetical protein
MKELERTLIGVAIEVLSSFDMPFSRGSYNGCDDCARRSLGGRGLDTLMGSLNNELKLEGYN